MNGRVSGLRRLRGRFFDVNRRGEAVGTAWDEELERWVAVVWDGTALVTLPDYGGLMSRAEGINNRGEIAGWVTNPDNDRLGMAGVWRKAKSGKSQKSGKSTKGKGGKG